MEARSCSSSSLFFVLALLAHWCSTSTASCSFTISNYCSHPIWPGTMAGAGTPQLPTTGFRLDPGQTAQVPAPAGWSGRIWARTGCDFNAGGAGSCETGDCGGRMECAGAGGKPPATLFEITLGKGAATDQDFYDVSLVDGYNLPVVAVPRARQGGGSCNTTGCTADLNLSCPKELQVDGAGGGGAVACRSACEAFGQDKYCCSGAYATPTTCHSTAYSSIFKSACPRAYSYAYDDGTSIFTCNAVDYTIAFCLPPTGSPGAPANGQSNGGNANNTAGNSGAGSAYQPPPTGDNGAGSAYQPPPTGNNGAGSASQPPPTGDNGAGSAYQPPPTGNNGAGSAYQPPPTGMNGSGSTFQPPSAGNNGAYQPPPTGMNGAGSAFQPPPTGNNGAGSTYQPPPTGMNGAGGTFQPPPIGNNGGYQPPSTPPASNNDAGSVYQYGPPLEGNSGVRSAAYQPWMVPSSATTQYNQLWFLLPAVFIFLY